MSSEFGTKFKRGLRTVFFGAVAVTGAGYVGSALPALTLGTLQQHQMSWQGKTGIECTYNIPDICTPKKQAEFNAYTRVQALRGAGTADLAIGVGLVVLGFSCLPKKKQPSV